MRITNKIIQNNSLTNINNNKLLQDKLSTQLATEKKIDRPSDDPIIALRSLRLRTSVSQTEQYREKNAEDAESWLEVTEDAINTLSDIITDIRKQYVKGSSDTLKSADRGIILENLESLAAEIYNTGNADFAGRSLFTGYRTSSRLTFQKAETLDYTIAETFSVSDIEENRHIQRGDMSNEQQVEDTSIYRLRLSYDNCKDQDFTINAGNAQITVSSRSLSDTPSPYENIPSGEAVFIHETGEIIFSQDAYNTIKSESAEEFEVEYGKEEWLKGDLRPEHYFKCKDNTQNIEYNYESSPEAEICYNIGVNQSLRINTNASECFTHDIKRDIDDIIRKIKEVTEIEEQVAKLQADLDALPENDPGRTAAQDKLDAAKKVQTYLNDDLSSMFSHGITNAESYLTRNNLALTNCGTRSKRLELIQNRLDTQLSTLKELKSENEDVDMAETAIKLSSAGYAYDASLMATSKIVKESLLNYL